MHYSRHHEQPGVARIIPPMMAVPEPVIRLHHPRYAYRTPAAPPNAREHHSHTRRSYRESPGQSLSPGARYHDGSAQIDRPRPKKFQLDRRGRSKHSQRQPPSYFNAINSVPLPVKITSQGVLLPKACWNCGGPHTIMTCKFDRNRECVDLNRRWQQSLDDARRKVKSQSTIRHIRNSKPNKKKRYPNKRYFVDSQKKKDWKGRGSDMDLDSETERRPHVYPTTPSSSVDGDQEPDEGEIEESPLSKAAARGQLNIAESSSSSMPQSKTPRKRKNRERSREKHIEARGRWQDEENRKRSRERSKGKDLRRNRSSRGRSQWSQQSSYNTHANHSFESRGRAPPPAYMHRTRSDGRHRNYNGYDNEYRNHGGYNQRSGGYGYAGGYPPSGYRNGPPRNHQSGYSRPPPPPPPLRGYGAQRPAYRDDMYDGYGRRDRHDRRRSPPPPLAPPPPVSRFPDTTGYRNHNRYKPRMHGNGYSRGYY